MMLAQMAFFFVYVFKIFVFVPSVTCVPIFPQGPPVGADEDGPKVRNRQFIEDMIKGGWKLSPVYQAGKYAHLWGNEQPKTEAPNFGLGLNDAIHNPVRSDFDTPQEGEESARVNSGAKETSSHSTLYWTIGILALLTLLMTLALVYICNCCSFTKKSSKRSSTRGSKGHRRRGKGHSGKGHSGKGHSGGHHRHPRKSVRRTRTNTTTDQPSKVATSGRSRSARKSRSSKSKRMRT